MCEIVKILKFLKNHNFKVKTHIQAIILKICICSHGLHGHLVHTKIALSVLVCKILSAMVNLHWDKMLNILHDNGGKYVWWKGC